MVNKVVSIKKSVSKRTKEWTDFQVKVEGKGRFTFSVNNDGIILLQGHVCDLPIRVGWGNQLVITKINDETKFPDLDGTIKEMKFIN